MKSLILLAAIALPAFATLPAEAMTTVSKSRAMMFCMDKGGTFKGQANYQGQVWNFSCVHPNGLEYSYNAFRVIDAGF